jgi:hypothetical protein
MAIVTDDINGPGVDNRAVAYCDGTDWRRLSDGTVIAYRPAAASLSIAGSAPTVA